VECIGPLSPLHSTCCSSALLIEEVSRCGQYTPSRATWTKKNRPEVAQSLVNDKTPVRLQWQREDVTGQGKRDAERCERLP
jgi:hypothetical protein